MSSITLTRFVSIAFGIFLVVFSPITSFGQNRKEDRCRLYVINSKEFQEGVPSGEKEEDGSPISKGVTVLGRFSPKLAEEEYTTQQFDFPGESLKIVATVYFTDESLRTKLTWNSISLGVTIGSQGKQGEPVIVRDSVAEFPYLPHYKVRAFTSVTTEKANYGVILECKGFNDDELGNELKREFCRDNRKGDQKQKYQPPIKKKNTPK